SWNVSGAGCPRRGRSHAADGCWLRRWATCRGGGREALPPALRDLLGVGLRRRAGRRPAEPGADRHGARRGDESHTGARRAQARNDERTQRTEPTMIRTGDVRFVKELYPRLRPHDDVVERYRDAIDNLPPIVVARDGVLVDGYHRWQAH